MRPASIVQFERLFLASLAVRILANLIGFGDTLAAIKANPATGAYGASAVVTVMVLIWAIAVALWYFAARKASAVAKWILAAWFVIAACTMALGLFRGGFGLNLATLLSWATFLLLAWSVSYLFKPDADAWFAKPSAS